MRIDRKDVVAALDLLEDRYPDAAWSLSTIENDQHMVPPFGRGVSVQLTSPDGMAVWEKAETFFEAARRVADRMDRRRAIQFRRKGK